MKNKIIKEGKKPVEPRQPHKPYIPDVVEPLKTIKQYEHLGNIKKRTYDSIRFNDFQDQIANITKNHDKNKLHITFDAYMDRYDRYSVDEIVINISLEKEIPNPYYIGSLKSAEIIKEHNKKIINKYNKEVKQYEEDYREYEIEMKKYLDKKFGE